MMDIDIYNSYIEVLKNLLKTDISYFSYNINNNIGRKNSQIGAMAKLKDSYNYLDNLTDKIIIAHEKSLKH
jgi:hypothetical protein